MLRSLITSGSRQAYTCLVVANRTSPNLKEFSVHHSDIYSCYRGLHTTSALYKLSKDSLEKRSVMKHSREPDSLTIANNVLSLEEIDMMFPTLQTADMLIDGVPYKYLHIVSINATPNNTHMVITEANGKPVYGISSGCVGFRNSRKSTAVAAQAVALEIYKRAKSKNIQNIRVNMKGNGQGREAGLRALQKCGLNVVSITDVTPIPFGGNRPPKVRRL